ncbi:MAG: hypothetical protein AAGA18_09075 [Verrucomicrobiota bacterium]
MQRNLNISKRLIGIYLIVLSFFYSTLYGQDYSEELARDEQLKAPEKMIIEVLSVRKKNKGFLWGPAANQEVELEARVVEVDRSKSGTAPGSVIRIRYVKPTMASTGLNPPPVPKQGKSTPAFMVKRGNWFYPVAHHLSFSAMTQEQRNELLAIEQQLAERKAREEKILKGESEILGGLDAPVSYEDEQEVLATTVLEQEQVQADAESLASLEQAAPIEEITVAEETEVSVPPRIPTINDLDVEQNSENDAIRDKVDAEMIARNEARRRAKAEKEQIMLARQVVQNESKKRAQTSNLDGASIPVAAFPNASSQAAFDMDQPIPNSGILDEPTATEISIEPNQEVNPTGEEIRIAEEEIGQAEEKIRLSQEVRRREQEMDAAKEEVRGGEIIKPIMETAEPILDEQMIEISDEELNIPEAPRIIMKETTIKRPASENAEPLSANENAFAEVAKQPTPPNTASAEEEKLDFVPFSSEDKPEADLEKVAKAEALKRSAQENPSSSIFYEPDPRRLEYKRYFSMVQDAEIAHLQGNLEKAIENYKLAIIGLERLKKNESDFYPEVVEYRLLDCKNRLQSIEIEQKAKLSVENGVR